MTIKKSVWVLFGILLISAWVLGSAIQAGAETMKCKSVQTTTKIERMEVGDEKGHLLALQRMEGLAYCENGEIAKMRSDNVSDFVPGKGVEALGYTFFTFEDGATIIVRFQRSVAFGQSAIGSAKASSEIIKGTGRFEGIKGTTSGTGKNFLQTKEEPGRAFTDITLTYTLPTKGSAAQAIGDMPKDVYPDSGFRLPIVKKEDLDDYGKKVYEKVFGTGSISLFGARGPLGIRLYSPKVLELHNSLTDYLRQSGLGGSVRELAILITAREMDNQFEWAAHEPQGLKEGLPQSIIDIVKYRRGVEGLPETEAVIIQLGREIFGKKKVDSNTFARALKIFGPKQLVDLVTLMGTYSLTAALISAFDMQLDPKQKQFVLPMP
jgi:4-carboxymuconolactone decarboxylase